MLQVKSNSKNCSERVAYLHLVKKRIVHRVRVSAAFADTSATPSTGATGDVVLSFAWSHIGRM